MQHVVGLRRLFSGQELLMKIVGLQGAAIYSCWHRNSLSVVKLPRVFRNRGLMARILWLEALEKEKHDYWGTAASYFWNSGPLHSCEALESYVSRCQRYGHGHIHWFAFANVERGSCQRNFFRTILVSISIKLTMSWRESIYKDALCTLVTETSIYYIFYSF